MGYIFLLFTPMQNLYIRSCHTIVTVVGVTTVSFFRPKINDKLLLSISLYCIMKYITQYISFLKNCMYNYQNHILILWPVHDTFVTSAESGKNVRLDMKGTLCENWSFFL